MPTSHIAGIRALLGAMLMVLWLTQASARDVLQSFVLAARAGDTSFLLQMPDLGLNEQTQDDLRNNLLMLAVREDGDAMALAMLSQPNWSTPEVLNYRNQLGETALMLAALKGSVPIVSRLLTLGAQPNQEGWTTLHYAATSGHADVIRLLIEKNVYVDAESPNKTTPLMMAARFNHQPAAKALLDGGADPTKTNEAGLTARDYAKENNNRDLAFWLELEEISFTQRYLKRMPKTPADATLESVVIEAGGSVVKTVDPAAENGAVAAPVVPEVRPGPGVEVFPIPQ